LPVDGAAFVRAFEEVGSESPMLTEEASQQIMQQLQMAMMMRQGAPFTEDDPLPISVDTLNYAYAAGFAGYIKENGYELTSGALLQGILDATSTDVEATPMMDAGAVDIKFQAMMSDITAKEEAKAAEAAKETIEAGEAFLAENANAEGVTVTASGLQYKVLKQGNGPKPTPADFVEVHYHGRLLDGSVFDSSVERGQPAQFGVTQVIQGWIEGLQLMNTGSKYEFWIPQEIAYGMRDSPTIPAGSVLNFEVELLDIIDAPAAPAMGQ